MSGNKPIWIGEQVLKSSEWLAENAYVAPGSHRFLTALGLLSGLSFGRYMMDIMTATDRNGNNLQKGEVLPPLQRFHGVWSYNKYADTPDAKWHKVIDNMTPVIFGAMGAMIGSGMFASRFNPISRHLLKELESGMQNNFLQHADYASAMIQSNRLNRLAGANFTLGSTTGSHLFPNPLSNMVTSLRFQLAAGKKVMLPGLFKITGNRGTQSSNLYNSLRDMISWAENNIAHYGGRDWMRDNGAIMRKAKNALQTFKDITPAQEQEFIAYIEKTVRNLEEISAKIQQEHGAMSGEELLKCLRTDERFVSTIHNRFWSNGLEDQFVKMGLIDPKNPLNSKILIGDNGVISQFARWLGGGRDIGIIEREWAQGVQMRHGFSPTVHTIRRAEALDTFPINGKLAAATALGAGTLGLTALLGSKQAHAKLSSDDYAQLNDLPRHEAARKFHAIQDRKTPTSLYSSINGKPLDALSWLSSVFVVAPGLHRFMNAAFLGGFLYGGMKVSTALAGRGLRGEVLAKEQIWPMLRPLHNKLSYVWKGQTTQDRIRYSIHQIIPVASGAVGTYTGSRLYFQNRIDDAKKAEYLEDYTDKVSMDESESYAKLSGATSILNTGSGFHLLPFVSYASNLQNRFLMAKGQQVATPGLGKFWSNNPSKYPYHIKKLLHVMIDYATHNPSEFPREFDDMAHAFVAKLYPDMPQNDRRTKQDAFVDAIYAVRDKYWQDGGIPEEQKAACKKELQAHFTKEGLEKTMIAIGLDPLQANIDNNGASGRFAKALGSNTEVRRDIADYKRKVGERIKRYERQTRPDTHIPSPAQNIAVDERVIAAENQPTHS